MHDAAHQFWQDLDASDQPGELALAVAPDTDTAAAQDAFASACQAATATAALSAAMTPGLVAAFWPDAGAARAPAQPDLPGAWMAARRAPGEPAAALRARLQAQLHELEAGAPTRGAWLHDARGLWQRVDRVAGPGSLLLVALESWLRVADTHGIAASDAHLWAFLGRCVPATASAGVRAHAGHPFFAAYWDGADDGEPERVRASLPGELADIAVSYRDMGLGPLEAWATVLRRASWESASDLFDRAEGVLGERRASLPAGTLSGHRLMWHPRELPGPR